MQVSFPFAFLGVPRSLCPSCQPVGQRSPLAQIVPEENGVHQGLLSVFVVSERQSATPWVANRAGGQGVKLRRGCLLFSFTSETSYLLTTFTEHPDCCRELCKLAGMQCQGFASRVHSGCKNLHLDFCRPHSESFKSCRNMDLVVGQALNLLALLLIEDHD